MSCCSRSILIGALCLADSRLVISNKLFTCLLLCLIELQTWPVTCALVQLCAVLERGETVCCSPYVHAGAFPIQAEPMNKVVLCKYCTHHLEGHNHG